MRKRAYRSVAVKNVNISEVLNQLAEGPVSVGMDVAKKELLAVVRDSAGNFLRPWKVRQPDEIPVFVKLLVELNEHRRTLVALESTGTYGDALRQALADAGLSVHRVSAKATHDYAEVFDGVPSNHDGKDAAILAELAAIGKSKPWAWQEASDWESKLEQQVDWLDVQQDILQMWLGRIEAQLARYWPEVLKLLKLNSGTLLRVLAEDGGPAKLARDPRARKRMQFWSGGFLTADKIEAVVKSATSTLGVRMNATQIEVLRQFAQQALQARKEVRLARQALKELAKGHSVLQRMATVVGIGTACVLWVVVGDPRSYHCAEAYRKALGLNLKERSSGKYQGKLKITKRGPSMGRRWLFFASMRTVQKAGVCAWYQAKKQRDNEQAMKALVAVMRKLALAVHVVATTTQDFCAKLLFPGRDIPRTTSQSERGMKGERSEHGLISEGGSAPQAPRNLSPSCQTRKGKNRAATGGLQPPDLSTLAPGSALGSVSTGALSSAQSKKI